jgi:HEAT repeat protein
VLALKVMSDSYGGQEAQGAFGALIDCLRSDELGDDAVLVFSSIGPKAMNLVPQMVSLVDSGPPSVRIRASVALAFVDKSHPRPVACLIGLLADRSEHNRARAACALGTIGESAAPALGPLEKALADPSGKVRERAAWAIRFLGKDSLKAVGKLRDLAANDVDVSVRREATKSIEDIEKNHLP